MSSPKPCSPAGNVYDKYGTKNPLARWLVSGFRRALGELVEPVSVSVENLLEVGCGEGHVLEILDFNPSCGLDIDVPIVREARRRYPAGRFLAADGARLPFAIDQFDLVMGIEVLEHVPHPETLIREARRVSRRYCLFSVPREPLWRVLNVARGRYLTELGNTPGHVQHWSAAAFVRLLEAHLRVVAVKKPTPWTMALCEV